MLKKIIANRAFIPESYLPDHANLFDITSVTEQVRFLTFTCGTTVIHEPDMDTPEEKIEANGSGNADSDDDHSVAVMDRSHLEAPLTTTLGDGSTPEIDRVKSFFKDLLKRGREKFESDQLYMPKPFGAHHSERRSHLMPGLSGITTSQNPDLSAPEMAEVNKTSRFFNGRGRSARVAAYAPEHDMALEDVVEEDFDENEAPPSTRALEGLHHELPELPPRHMRQSTVTGLSEAPSEGAFDAAINALGHLLKNECSWEKLCKCKTPETADQLKYDVREVEFELVRQLFNAFVSDHKNYSEFDIISGIYAAIEDIFEGFPSSILFDTNVYMSYLTFDNKHLIQTPEILLESQCDMLRASYVKLAQSYFEDMDGGADAAKREYDAMVDELFRDTDPNKDSSLYSRKLFEEAWLEMTDRHARIVERELVRISEFESQRGRSLIDTEIEAAKASSLDKLYLEEMAKLDQLFRNFLKLKRQKLYWDNHPKNRHALGIPEITQLDIDRALCDCLRAQQRCLYFANEPNYSTGTTALVVGHMQIHKKNFDTSSLAFPALYSPITSLASMFELTGDWALKVSHYSYSDAENTYVDPHVLVKGIKYADRIACAGELAQVRALKESPPRLSWDLHGLQHQFKRLNQLTSALLAVKQNDEIESKHKDAAAVQVFRDFLSSPEFTKWGKDFPAVVAISEAEDFAPTDFAPILTVIINNLRAKLFKAFQKHQIGL